MHNTGPRSEGALPCFATATFPADIQSGSTVVEGPQKCQTFPLSVAVLAKVQISACFPMFGDSSYQFYSSIDHPDHEKKHHRSP